MFHIVLVNDLCANKSKVLFSFPRVPITFSLHYKPLTYNTKSQSQTQEFTLSTRLTGQ